MAYIDNLDSRMREALRATLQLLADGPRQSDGWLVSHDFPPASELASMLLDDLDVAEYFQRGVPPGATELDRLLESIAAHLSRIDIETDPKDILANSDWISVCALAAKALPLVQ